MLSLDLGVLVPFITTVEHLLSAFMMGPRGRQLALDQQLICQLGQFSHGLAPLLRLGG
jgi:hypothetical protein